MTEINNASHRKTNSTFHFLSCGYFHFPSFVYFHFSPVRIITFTFHLLNVFTFSLLNAFIFHLGIFSLSLSWMLSLSLFLCDTWFWESHCLLSLGNWGTGGVQKNRTRCQGLAACSNIMRRYKCVEPNDASARKCFKNEMFEGSIFSLSMKCHFAQM